MPKLMHELRHSFRQVRGIYKRKVAIMDKTVEVTILVAFLATLMAMLTVVFMTVVMNMAKVCWK
jgi:hypothetical protein